MPTSSQEVFGAEVLPPHEEKSEGMFIPCGMVLPAVDPALSGAETEPPDPKPDPEPGNPPACIPPGMFPKPLDDCHPPPEGIVPEEPPEDDGQPEEEVPVEGLLPVDDLPPVWLPVEVWEEDERCTAKSDELVMLLLCVLSRLNVLELSPPPNPLPPPPKPPLPPMEPMADTFTLEPLTSVLALRCPLDVEGIVPSSCPRMLCPRREQYDCRFSRATSNSSAE